MRTRPTVGVEGIEKDLKHLQMTAKPHKQETYHTRMREQDYEHVRKSEHTRVARRVEEDQKWIKLQT